jgi:hypothetical protein
MSLDSSLARSVGGWQKRHRYIIIAAEKIRELRICVKQSAFELELVAIYHWVSEMMRWHTYRTDALFYILITSPETGGAVNLAPFLEADS